MEEEAELLRRFAQENDQQAFAEIVRRQVDLVFAAALRQVGGDSHLAEDVTQGVFLALAQAAPRLARHTSLTGWLYTSTRFISAKTRRAHRRWQARQNQAHIMQTILADGHESQPDWHELRPVIDDAMHELPAPDREVILLRYFEGRPLADLSIRYGLGENSVRMRVERALERLRQRLARRGITSTAGALGAALAGQPAIAAPAGLATAAASSSLAGLAAGGGGAAALSLFAFMSTTKITIGIAAVLALAGLGYFSHEKNQQALDQADAQRRQAAQLALLRAENLRLKTDKQILASVPVVPPAPAPRPNSSGSAPVETPAAIPGVPLLALYASGFGAGIRQSHAEIFQKLGMTPEQEQTYIDLRMEQNRANNQVVEEATARGEDEQAVTALLAQSNARAWDKIEAAIGEANSTGIQQYLAATRAQGRGTAPTRLQVTSQLASPAP